MSHSVPPVYDLPRPALLSVTEVATLLGISRPSVYRMVRRGDLRPFRVGERLRFSLDEIDAYLERGREPAP